MDFEQDQQLEITVSDQKLKDLARLATQQLLVEQEIEKAEDHLKALGKVLKVLSETKIPELMREIGMAEFKLANGACVSVAPFYTGTVDDTNIDGVKKWLKEKGHTALLKKDLTLSFGTEDIDVQEVFTYVDKWLKEKEVEYISKIKEGVHHGTLKAFIKEQVTSGAEFPLALFKGFVGSKTKITL